MTPVWNNINAKYLTLRKERNPANAAAIGTLSALIGDIQRLAKDEGREVNDLDAIKLVKSSANKCQETIGFITTAMATDCHAPKLASDLALKTAEAQLYRDLLPKQMTNDELKSVIATIVQEVQAVTKKDTGKVMKVLRDRHEGVYDGKTAITLVAEVLV